MKKTLSLLLMLMLALQSLIAAADVHHVLEPAVSLQSVHHHEHHAEQASMHQQEHPDVPESALDHHPCCHTHVSVLPFLTPNDPPCAGDVAARLLFPARHLLFFSWISAPDLRPPIV